MQTKKRKGIPTMFLAMILMGIGLVGGAVSPSFKEPKKYQILMTLDEINATIYCLQQSNAPSVNTNNIINLISSQVNPVLQAEQKKIQDSLDKQKTKPKN